MTSSPDKVHTNLNDAKKVRRSMRISAAILVLLGLGGSG